MNAHRLEAEVRRGTRRLASEGARALERLCVDEAFERGEKAAAMLHQVREVEYARSQVDWFEMDAALTRGPGTGWIIEAGGGSDGSPPVGDAAGTVWREAPGA